MPARQRWLNRDELTTLAKAMRESERFGHVSPDTLNVALRTLPLGDMEHFTVHDMRRTVRTHMAALGVDRFVVERALNHKVRDVERSTTSTTTSRNEGKPWANGSTCWWPSWMAWADQRAARTCIEI